MRQGREGGLSAKEIDKGGLGLIFRGVPREERAGDYGGMDVTREIVGAP
jgi:hypothetical protein